MKRRRSGDIVAQSTRDRIVNAAFCAFMEHGYAGASTLDIATRAKVSKRELYSHFRNKQELFQAGITERTQRMRLAAEVPDISNLAGLAEALKGLGRAVLSGVTDENVLAVYRLAVAEAARSPQVARTLDTAGRSAVRRALTNMLEEALRRRLIQNADAGELADRFLALLWSDLLVRLILRVARRPNATEIARRADAATEAFLVLYGNKDRADLASLLARMP